MGYFAAIAFLFTGLSTSVQAHWLENVQEAHKIAAEKKQYVLTAFLPDLTDQQNEESALVADFVEDVLDSNPFLEAVRNRFVLVKVTQRKEELNSNPDFKAFRLKVAPILVASFADRRPFSIILAEQHKAEDGTLAFDPDFYAAHLKAIFQSGLLIQTFFARAANFKGFDGLNFLDQAFNLLRVAGGSWEFYEKESDLLKSLAKSILESDQTSGAVKAQTYKVLALHHYHKDEELAAIGYLRSAATLAKESREFGDAQELLHFLASVLYEHGFYKEVENVAQEAHDVIPLGELAQKCLLLKGIALESRGEHQLAKETFEAARDIDPNSPTGIKIDTFLIERELQKPKAPPKPIA